MKRFLFFLLFCGTVFYSLGQQRGESDVIVDKFPEVTFNWNEYNPNPIGKAQVSLSVDDKKVGSFSWTNVPHSNSSKKKSVLILWEDMKSHTGQFDFTRMTLSNFFSNIIDDGDRFNVVVFNRDQANGFFLNSISYGFTSDVASLRSSVNVYEPSKNTFKNQPYCSNVYQAINEGIELLTSEPKGNLKAIIVITAGMNMNTAGSSKELNTVTALERNIPIYVVKFPVNGDHSAKDVEGVEKTTFGTLIVPTSMKDDKGTAEQLYDTYQTMAKRYYGQDYKVSFEAQGDDGKPAKPDGKSHTVKLTINGKTNTFVYNSPKYTFSLWIKDNLVLFIVIIVVVVAIITLSIIFGIKYGKKKKKRVAQNDAELKNRIQDNEKRSDDLSQRLKGESFRNKQGHSCSSGTIPYGGNVVGSTSGVSRTDSEYLQKMMDVKNLYPRLKCTIGTVSKNITLEHPFTTIGRDSDNDIIFTPTTVSRHHAELIFNGAGFEIVNLSSTNKVVVNGSFVDNAGLKSGDVIGIGEVIIAFYV